MRKWVEFNLRHPKVVLIALILITIASSFGVTRLQFDSSTDVLMPRSDPIYQMGERAKLSFSDSQTFIISSIEASEGKNLFSGEVFSHIREMVLELREYHEFDKAVEDQRLTKIINAGGVSISVPGKSVQISGGRTEKSSLEAELDAEFFGSGSESGTEKSQKVSNLEVDLDKEILGLQTRASENEEQLDIWDLNTVITEERYETPLRERNLYDYSNYSGVSIAKIRASLDVSAGKVLDTVILRHGIETDEQLPLSKSEFQKILEGFEDIYLFKSFQIIRNIIDPVSGEDIRGTKTELKPVGLLEKVGNTWKLPQNEREFEEYRRRLVLNPAYESTLFARNSDAEISSLGMSVIFRLQRKYDRFMEYFWAIMQKYNQRPVVMNTMGTLVFNKFMNDFSQNDLRTFMPLVILIVVITFFLNFHSGRGLVLPTLTVIFAMLWTVGLMGLWGIKMTIMTTILPPLLIAIGSSYSIHIFNQYLSDLHLLHEEGQREGLLDAMSHISTTVFLAGFTTFIGFMTLMVNQVTALREFGIFSAIGTLFSMFVAISLIPSALMLLKLLPLKEKQANQEHHHEGNWLVKNIVRGLSYFMLNFPKLIAVIVVISLGIAAFGVSKLTTETSPSTYFKPDSYIRKASSHIGKVFNGSMLLNVVFDSGRKGGARDPEFLRYIEDVRTFIAKPEHREKYNMLHTTSFGDFIKRLHMAMNADDPAYYTIPDSEITVRDYLEIFSGEDDNADGRADAFEPVVDKDYRRINMSIRLGELDGRLVGTAMFRAARDYLSEQLPLMPNPGGYTHKILGEPMNLITLGDYIVSGQIQSLILSVIIVGLIVFLLFRNLLAGIAALIPISASVLLVFGIMGYAGIPLDMAKAILSSIAIGIGVDDTIHFMNTLRKQLQSGVSLREAIRMTHRLAGVAIVYTSIALIFGFAVLMFSSFTPIFHFGFLVSLVMIATTFAALLILPTVIYLGNWQIHEELNWKILQKLNFRRFLE